MKSVKLIENLANLDKSTWDVVRFSDVAREVKDISRDPISEGIEKVIGLEHLAPLDIHIRTWGDIADGKTFTKKFSKGQILFGRRRAYQRKAALANFDGICSGDIIVMEAIKEKLEPRLLPFLVHSEGFCNCAVSTSAGSLSPRTKFKSLAEYEFRLPSMEMQKKLAKLLWAVDETEENALRVYNDTREYKISYLENNLLDKKGKKILLGNIGEFVRGVGYKPEDLGLDDKDHIALLRANNLQDSEITLEDLKFVHRKNVNEIQYLKTGDIVICMSNGSKELVGKTAVFSENGKDFCFGSFCGCFRVTDTKYSGIVKYLFQTPSYRDQIKYLLSGSTINNLKPSDIESMSFNISEKNLEKAKTELQKIGSFEENQKKYLFGIRNLKQSLINSIF